MTIFVTIDRELRPEAADAYCDGLQQMLADTAAFQGFRSVRVVRNATNPNRVLLFEEWERREDYDAYVRFRIERGDVERIGRIAISSKLDFWPALVAGAAS